MHLTAQSRDRTYNACCEPIETFNDEGRMETHFVWRTFDPVLSLRIIKFATKLLRQVTKSEPALAMLQHLPGDSHDLAR
jgi:hypothetical protein